MAATRWRKTDRPASWSVRFANRVAIAAMALAAMALAAGSSVAAKEPTASCEFHDSHFHLTNYVQEGISARQFLAIMGARVCRSTLFGIPLQQQWSHRVTGDVAPTYYLDSDAHLYYYSFTDAFIAQQYLSLAPKERARFDPMITGFNPTDMYAADHIRRVLQTFPGVFTGIGEFTIHKEFVSSKIEGDVASLEDPALDRLLEFAGDTGLVVILHNDISMPFPKPEQARAYYEQLKNLLRRHPRTRIVWAHLGVGRIVRPLQHHGELIDEIANDAAFNHVAFDISWDEVAKYMLQSPETIAYSVALIERHAERIVFGTDTVAPASAEKYYAVFAKYGPVLDRLTPATRAKVLRTNYERIFDEGRRKVRVWEAANPARPAGSDSPASGERPATESTPR